MHSPKNCLRLPSAAFSFFLFFTAGAQLLDDRPICREYGDMHILFKPYTTEIEIEAALGQIAAVRGPLPRYQVGSRWSQTSRMGSTGTSGNPVTLSYSLVPDGTTVPDSGYGSGPNILASRMNTLFSGNTALWKQKFAQAFQRWDELTGLTILEDPDDGAVMHSSAGVAGVRGDCRISMIALTNNNVLAYNYFPNNGDMVINSTYSWGLSTYDYRRLRNVLMHEHGHGIGLNHVIPQNATKLMEPALNENFDGPQHDDIQGGQRNYGDADENNDTSGTRKDLGTATNGYTRTNLSLDRQTDIDWYRIIVPSGMSLTVTASPVGMTYQQGPQGGTATSRNSLAIHNLRLTAFQTNGTTIVEGPQDTAGIGQAEVLSGIIPPVSGEVLIRVDTTTTTNDIQMYQLTLNLVPTVTLHSLTLNSSTALGGEIVGGTVTLTGAAGAGGVTVQLSSSDVNAATVPLNVIVPQGSTSAPFDVTTQNVSEPTPVTITGTHSGTQRTANLTVNPAPISFGPLSVSAGPGLILSGDSNSLQESDDVRLLSRPGAVAISTLPPLVLLMETSTPLPEASRLDLTLEGSVSVGNVHLVVQMYVPDSAIWETVFEGTEPTTEQTRTISITSNPSRFVNLTTGQIRLRMSYKATGPVPTFPWQSRLDLVRWTAWY